MKSAVFFTTKMAARKLLLLEVAARTAEKISWSVAQFITEAIIFPAAVALFVSSNFFTNRDKTENFLQRLGAMRGRTGSAGRSALVSWI